jgi:hypothetical protein
MANESINLRLTASQIDAMSTRQVAALLVSMLNDINALRTWAAAHQHSALSAAPTTTPAALNTLA